MKKLSVDFSKISDFELSILLAERDIAHFRYERLDQIISEIGQVLGMAESEKPQRPEIDEKVFSSLKFEAQQGQKLGQYEIADKIKNNPEDWQKAYDILKKAGATIKDRVKGQNFTFWLYGDFERIYRQKRREK